VPAWLIGFHALHITSGVPVPLVTPPPKKLSTEYGQLSRDERKAAMTKFKADNAGPVAPQHPNPKILVPLNDLDSVRKLVKTSEALARAGAQDTQVGYLTATSHLAGGNLVMAFAHGSGTRYGELRRSAEHAVGIEVIEPTVLLSLMLGEGALVGVDTDWTRKLMRTVAADIGKAEGEPLVPQDLSSAMEKLTGLSPAPNDREIWALA